MLSTTSQPLGSALNQALGLIKELKNWPAITLITPATGMPNNAPHTPPTFDPSNIAPNTTSGCTPTEWLITRGPTILTMTACTTTTMMRIIHQLLLPAQLIG